MIGFEWDDAKDLTNRQKRGISFEEASTIFDGPVLSHEDAAIPPKPGSEATA